MKTVLIFGTFDFLHAGHIAMIRQARRLGEQLIVVIARDETVKRVKGAFPIHSERDRKAIMEAIRYVDTAVLGDKQDVYSVIKKIRPDVIALGYDQQVFVEQLREKLIAYHLNTKIVRLKQHKNYKSSLIKTM